MENFHYIISILGNARITQGMSKLTKISPYCTPFIADVKLLIAGHCINPSVKVDINNFTLTFVF